jgi:hypothetical protein
MLTMTFTTKLSAALIAASTLLPAAQALAGSELAFQRPSSQTKICKQFVVDSGVGRSRTTATQRAVRHWSSKVSSSYGRAFANWNTGIVKRTSCRKNNIEPGYTCRASAKPCFLNGQVIGS